MAVAVTEFFMGIFSDLFSKLKMDLKGDSNIYKVECLPRGWDVPGIFGTDFWYTSP